jgi:hypothetical protein
MEGDIRYMNIKIENQKLRFKITEDELAKLCAGHCLNTQVNFLNKVFVTVINPQGLTKGMDARLVCDEGDTYLTLFVSPDQTQELSDLGRSRQGIEVNIDGLTISLQVDLRSDSRKTIEK